MIAKVPFEIALEEARIWNLSEFLRAGTIRRFSRTAADVYFDTGCFSGILDKSIDPVFGDSDTTKGMIRVAEWIR